MSLTSVQLIAFSPQHAERSLKCLLPLDLVLPVVVILLSYFFLRVLCGLRKRRVLWRFLNCAILVVGVGLGLRMHRDYDLLQSVVLWNLLVSLCQLLKHFLCELVNGLVQLTRVRIGLVLKHVVAVELDSVPKHSDGLFRVKTGVHSPCVLCLLKVRNVCCAGCFAEKIIVTVLNLLILFLLLGFWTLQCAGLSEQSTSSSFCLQGGVDAAFVRFNYWIVY